MRRFFWIAYYVLDGLLIAVFVAGFLAYHVRTEAFWWIELIAVVLPYLAGLLLIASIPLILGGRWLLALIHSVLLLLFVIRIDLIGRAFNGVDLRSDDLTLLTFNVPRWWGYEMAEKTAEMAALVDSVDPGIIGLQEAPIAYYVEEPPVRAAPYVAVLIDSLGFSTIGPRSTGATWTPQPVLSKYSLIDQTAYSLRRHPDDEHETTVTRTHLRWNGRDFALYNVHLQTFGEKKPWQEKTLPFFQPENFVPYLRRYKRSYQIRAWEVEQILAMIEKEELPVIVLGDLNSTPHNWVYARLSSVLRDAFAERGMGWGMTYHTRLPVVRIDYVFVSYDWEIVSADVVDAYLSDHLPLLVRLRWKD